MFNCGQIWDYLVKKEKEAQMAERRLKEEGERKETKKKKKKTKQK